MFVCLYGLCIDSADKTNLLRSIELANFNCLFKLSQFSIAPINLNLNHWVGVAIDNTNKHLCYFDSFNSDRNYYDVRAQFEKKEPNYELITQPNQQRQQNGYDCGVYVIWNICTWLSLKPELGISVNLEYTSINQNICNQIRAKLSHLYEFSRKVYEYETNMSEETLRQLESLKLFEWLYSISHLSSQ